jgi:hypothetical protein
MPPEHTILCYNLTSWAKVHGYPNILQAKLYTLLLVVELTKLLTTNTYIFIDSLHNILSTPLPHKKPLLPIQPYRQTLIASIANTIKISHHTSPPKELELTQTSREMVKKTP